MQSALACDFGSRNSAPVLHRDGRSPVIAEMVRDVLRMDPVGCHDARTVAVQTSPACEPTNPKSVTVEGFLYDRGPPRYDVAESGSVPADPDAPQGSEPCQS